MNKLIGYVLDAHDWRFLITIMLLAAILGAHLAFAAIEWGRK